jgi:hypothetical protein
MHCLIISHPCSAIFHLKIVCGCKSMEVATKILLFAMAKMLFSDSVDVLLMSTSPSWTSLARAALLTLPHILVDSCVLGIAKQWREIVC